MACMHHYSTGAVDGIRDNGVYLHLNGVLDSRPSENDTVAFNLIPFEDMDMVQTMVQTEVNVLDSRHSDLLGPAVINNNTAHASLERL
jgi:hypothetical protein